MAAPPDWIEIFRHANDTGDSIVVAHSPFDGNIYIETTGFVWLSPSEVSEMTAKINTAVFPFQPSMRKELAAQKTSKV